VTAAARLCGDLGHEVSETSPTYDWDRFLSAFYDYWAFGYAPGIARAQQATGRSVGSENLEKVTLALVDRAAALTPERINQFITELFVISRDIEPFFGRWDVLMTPVCLSPAPPLGVLDDRSADVLTFDRMLSEFAPYTAIFNISGQPSMSVPLYQSKEGLPVGVLCTARIYDEATLIQLAAQFEEACPWVDRRPPVGVRPLQTVLPGK